MLYQNPQKSVTIPQTQKLSYFYRSTSTCFGLRRLLSSYNRKTYKLSYWVADRSLVRPRRKQANVSVRIAWIHFGAFPWRGKKKLDDSSRLDVVEIARVTWHASELVSFLVGLRTYQHLGTIQTGYISHYRIPHLLVKIVKQNYITLPKICCVIVGCCEVQVSKCR